MFINNLWLFKPFNFLGYFFESLSEKNQKCYISS